MDICEKIANKKKADLNAEQKARNELAKSFRKVAKSLRAKLPKIREAYRIFKTLHENGYGMYKDDMYLDRDQHYAKGYFLSDGWFHWPGFALRTPNVFFTKGGGANRFSCGINTESGKVVVGIKEFDDANEPLTDSSIEKMCKEGGNGWQFSGKGGYCMSGREIVSKLEYCDTMADTFCEKVTEFANKLVA